jgi:hypothetical protein
LAVSSGSGSQDALSLTDERIHLLLADMAMADRVLENGEIGGGAGDAILVDQVLKQT